MDYLSGKQNGQVLNDKNKKESKSETSDSVFTDFCNHVLNDLDPDQRVFIAEKFLTPKVVSIMKDKELLDCINAFFKNNLNISETSRNAFLHRNTLLYRIEKVNKLTGLNIRNFEDAMSFKLISIIYENINKRNGGK